MYDKPGVGDWQVLRPGLCIVDRGTEDRTFGLGLGVLIGFIITAYLSVVGFSYPGMEEMAVRFNLPDRMYPSISLLSLMLGPGIVAIGSLLGHSKF